MKNINPYLNFNGNCEEAFEFYRSAFGGEFLTKSKFKDGPAPSGVTLTADQQEKILHVALAVGDNVLMGSDCPPWASPVTMGTNFAISISTKDQAETDKLFGKLSSSGGKVIMPLGKMFWGAYFGMCMDKFGISWMVNYDQSKSEATAKPSPRSAKRF
jgi:PhnB protein